VLTWHPAWPREKGKEIEPELWKETHGWNQGVILWLVSPDKKIKEPIPYRDKKKGGTLSAKQLEARFKEILKKHKVEFVEPPKPKPQPKPKAEGGDKPKGEGDKEPKDARK
jgi:hypothetical protein